MVAEAVSAETLDEEILHRAHEVADQAVEAEGPSLISALDSGNVVEIERVFYRVFRAIYLRGVQDGRS